MCQKDFSYALRRIKNDRTGDKRIENEKVLLAASVQQYGEKMRGRGGGRADYLPSAREQCPEVEHIH